jgi:threonine/homoserine/homoserine lactone efflux protein
VSYYIEGIFAGLLLSFLVGPLFFMLIRVGIDHGFRATMIYCAGIWLSDLSYIFFTYFGVTYLVALTKLQGFELYAGLIGGVILVAFGLSSMILKSPTIQTDALLPPKISKISLFLKGFIINTINPFTVFFWLVLSGKLSLQQDMNHSNAILFYAGLYTMLISTDVMKALLAKKIQEKLTPHILNTIKKLLGFALVVSGIVLIIRVVYK